MTFLAREAGRQHKGCRPFHGLEIMFSGVTPRLLRVARGFMLPPAFTG